MKQGSILETNLEADTKAAEEARLASEAVALAAEDARLAAAKMAMDNKEVKRILAEKEARAKTEEEAPRVAAEPKANEEVRLKDVSEFNAKASDGARIAAEAKAKAE